MPGVLVECDPSIKAIILKIDQEKHDFIVEDLDDGTLVIKEQQLQKLKARLAEVVLMITYFGLVHLPVLQELSSTLMMPGDSSGED